MSAPAPIASLRCTERKHVTFAYPGPLLISLGRGLPFSFHWEGDYPSHFIGKGTICMEDPHPRPLPVRGRGVRGRRHTTGASKGKHNYCLFLVRAGGLRGGTPSRRGFNRWLARTFIQKGISRWHNQIKTLKTRRVFPKLARLRRILRYPAAPANPFILPTCVASRSSSISIRRTTLPAARRKPVVSAMPGRRCSSRGSSC